MSTFHALGGRTVEVVDEDHWTVPWQHCATPAHLHIDFAQLPASLRPWWRAVMESAYKGESPAQAYNMWATALWLARYLERRDRLTTAWDDFGHEDWVDYAQWFAGQVTKRGRTPSLDYRRGQFLWLATAAKHAISLGLAGTSNVTIHRLHEVSRRVFRGTTAEAAARIERRALTGEQYAALYAMMASAWQLYLETKASGGEYRMLPTLVACWLAFNDGVRAAEINHLVVTDVRADPLGGKHQLYVHAPNKEPGEIPIDKDTMCMLQALIEGGADARATLATDRLFVSVTGLPTMVTTTILNRDLRCMVRGFGEAALPDDLMLPDGRTTLGTRLAREIGNRERVRRIMRHKWASTTETFYRARQKLVVAGNIAKALRAEAYRLTIAIQRPIIGISERPEQEDILERNPGNADLPWGSCGLDIERQGACRVATHCFECPLLVPWASKRHNFVHERDEYLRLAEQAENTRDRENRLYHANLAEAHVLLIDRRLEQERTHGIADDSTERHRQRRPRSKPTTPAPS